MVLIRMMELSGVCSLVWRGQVVCLDVARNYLQLYFWSFNPNFTFQQTGYSRPGPGWRWSAPASPPAGGWWGEKMLLKSRARCDRVECSSESRWAPAWQTGSWIDGWSWRGAVAGTRHGRGGPRGKIESQARLFEFLASKLTIRWQLSLPRPGWWAQATPGEQCWPLWPPRLPRQGIGGACWRWLGVTVGEMIPRLVRNIGGQVPWTSVRPGHVPPS